MRNSSDVRQSKMFWKKMLMLGNSEKIKILDLFIYLFLAHPDSLRGLDPREGRENTRFEA